MQTDIEFPFFVGILFIELYIIGFILNKIQPINTSNRYDTIDGLRGYLAFSVFIHHSVIWYQHLHFGTWLPPESSLFNQLGPSSVALFFMITSFLFFGKLLEKKGKEIDWITLFTSRILRLTPLYLLAITILFWMVFHLTNYSIKEAPTTLAKNILKWVFFTSKGAPDINTYPETSILISGVTWSLPHEWIFYLVLPFISLFINKRPSWFFLTLSMIGLASSKLASPFYHAFAFGMLIAWLCTKRKTGKILSGKTPAIIACLSFLIAITMFHGVDNAFQVFFLAVFFLSLHQAIIYLVFLAKRLQEKLVKALTVFIYFTGFYYHSH